MSANRLGVTCEACGRPPNLTRNQFQCQKDTCGSWVFSEYGRRVGFTQIFSIVFMDLMPGSGIQRSQASKIRKLVLHE